MMLQRYSISFNVENMNDANTNDDAVAYDYAAPFRGFGGGGEPTFAELFLYPATPDVIVWAAEPVAIVAPVAKVVKAKKPTKAELRAAAPRGSWAAGCR